MKTDVCLILEGTYPYVHGGVSSWIHKLVTSLSDIKFSIVHISATGDIIRAPKYEIPPNILEFKEVFVHDFVDEKGRTRGQKEEAWRALQNFYENMGKDDLSGFEEIYKYVINPATRSLNTHDLMFSKRAWEISSDLYEKYAGNISFVDFFWTVRFIHRPFLNLFGAEIPEADIYHTVCTGYAGLLSVIAKIKKDKPLVLTEHGIYTYERKIEISRAKWISSEAGETLRATRTLGFFKDAWIKKFDILSRLTYDHADKILTLFEGNRKMQIEAGADPSKSAVIPNGVDFSEDRMIAGRKRSNTNVIGFVGRVVSIKDVKTFIRAMKIVKESLKGAKIYILGSRDEEPKYFEECKVLVEMLQLEDCVVFTGNVDLKEYYPMLDVVVLTSISEAQPLSILEAMSYGIPTVASDVGACRELILGKDDKDREAGPSGMITNVGSPHETASAVLTILNNSDLWGKMSEVGIDRVKTHYRTDSMLEGYKDIYEPFLSK